jgi:large conductance mechanosensitive channel
MSMLKEFRDFVMRGNVVDLAVAVIIGAAFTAIVSSLVDDVITPLILTPALRMANVQDLDKLSFGAVKYGKFTSAVIKFIIISFMLFLIVKSIKSMQKKKVPAAQAPSSTDQLLMEIRDAVRK